MEDNKYKDTYMLLSRLKQDCDYYLGYGTGFEGNLWAGSVDAQYNKMKELYELLPNDGKPEWLSMEDIEEYYEDMKNYVCYNEYEIFQLNKKPENQKCLFMDSDKLATMGVTLNINMYDSVYAGKIKNYDHETLYRLYEDFNIRHPEDFKGHSLSISDVIVLSKGDYKKAFMVDDWGFKDLGDRFFENSKTMDIDDYLSFLTYDTVQSEVNGDKLYIRDTYHQNDPAWDNGVCAILDKDMIVNFKINDIIPEVYISSHLDEEIPDLVNKKDADKFFSNNITFVEVADKLDELGYKDLANDYRPFCDVAAGKIKIDATKYLEEMDKNKFATNNLVDGGKTTSKPEDLLKSDKGQEKE